MLQTILVCAGLLAQVAAIYIALRHFRAKTAADYMDRFSRPEMREIRQHIDKWLTQAPTDHERLQLLQHGEAAVTMDEIRVFANFFQELGLLCEERLVHRKTTRLLFDYLAPYYWGKLRPWVGWYRDSRNDQTLYARFERFATAMGYQAIGVH